ncbi:hypothetical protein B0H13DRAFT_2499906 [Mycena leptocephala]|nr:hypothetical protein B0H13DRAFT_2499906 [Mycena leptocephala]
MSNAKKPRQSTPLPGLLAAPSRITSLQLWQEPLGTDWTQLACVLVASLSFTNHPLPKRTQNAPTQSLHPTKTNPFMPPAPVEIRSRQMSQQKAQAPRSANRNAKHGGTPLLLLPLLRLLLPPPYARHRHPTATYRLSQSATTMATHVVPYAIAVQIFTGLSLPLPTFLPFSVFPSLSLTSLAFSSYLYSYSSSRDVTPRLAVDVHASLVDADLVTDVATDKDAVAVNADVQAGMDIDCLGLELVREFELKLSFLEFKQHVRFRLSVPVLVSVSLRLPVSISITGAVAISIRLPFAIPVGLPVGLAGAVTIARSRPPNASRSRSRPRGGGAERVCGVWVHRLGVLAKRCLRRVASEGVRAHACAYAETESWRWGGLEHEPKPERVGERVAGLHASLGSAALAGRGPIEAQSDRRSVGRVLAAWVLVCGALVLVSSGCSRERFSLRLDVPHGAGLELALTSGLKLRMLVLELRMRVGCAEYESHRARESERRPECVHIPIGLGLEGRARARSVWACACASEECAEFASETEPELA